MFDIFTGKEKLWVVSGKKDNFDVSPAINPGNFENITIKQNKERKFMFGLFSLTDLNQTEDHVQVNLFDAQQAMNGKRIKIWSADSSGKYEASLVLADGTTIVSLESTGTQQFREAERITKKDWLGWIIKGGARGSATVFSSILTASVGLPGVIV